MEKSTPVRTPHTSTADLLTWSETPPPPPAEFSVRRPQKPSGGISPALFGGQMTEEEVESVNKRKPCSGSKLREITGSGIFASNKESGGASDFGTSLTNSNNRTRQAISSISQISFSAEGSVSPKKLTSLPEVAKQRELSGTLESESEAKAKKQQSDAKCKELSGHDIFGPPPELPPRPLAARNLELKGQLDFGEPATPNTHTSVKPAGEHSNIVLNERSVVVKTAKKTNDQKFHELTGNDIFKGDDALPESTEKPLSSAKLREMSGSDIFADGKETTRDYFGGVRKPPGGGSSIALV